MSLEIVSPVIIVAAALILIALERRFPYTPGQRLFRDGFWTDLVGYSLIQSYFCGLLIAAFIRWIDSGTGLSRLHLVSDWPLWVQVGFFLITHDLYIYLFHRLQHRSKILWRVHEAHHSTRDVDWLSGSRSHTFEILINQTIEFAPIILLGAAPEVALIKGMISAIWGMYIHSNIDVRMGRLQKIINGPEMHRWHHSAEVADGSFNFATKLAFWDWIFGTGRLPAAKPAAYGLDDVDFPEGYFKQHLFAFRRFGDRPPAEPAAEAIAK
jgi:sterol desaturase/sphingolipid hydroxylase (fatty acid hydroxylase superfamily)